MRNLILITFLLITSCSTPKYCTGVVTSVGYSSHEECNSNTIYFYGVKTDIIVRSYRIYAVGDTIVYKATMK